MHFTNPKDFHDHYLLGEFLKLLIETEEINAAKDLYSKYIEINNSSTNVLVGLNILSYFPPDYAMDTLELIRKKCGEENLHSLVFNCPTINSDKFIEFCIDIGNSLSKAADFSIDMLFARLHNIDCSNKEKEIITFLEEKINQGYELFGSLNLLAYIGTNISVDFLMKYIESSNDTLQQKAFYCIRYIKERQNIDWYHNIEMVDYEIP